MRLLAQLGRAFVVLAMVCFAPAPAAAQEAEKPRIAVKMPTVGARIGRGAERHLNMGTLLAEMEAAIQKTRKFELLSRQVSTLAAVREEQEFAQSELAKGNAAPTGQLENANYLIIPTVQEFSFARTHEAVPNISEKYTERDSGALVVQAQIVDTATGAVKTTFYLKSNFSSGERVVNSASGAPGADNFTNMAKKVSAQMADQLVDTVFPMLVMTVQNNLIYINRGTDGGLKTGDLLNVYHPGEELVDPYTHEKLGATEQLLGKVKVVRVNPKFTEAAVSSKPPFVPARGDILRKP